MQNYSSSYNAYTQAGSYLVFSNFFGSLSNNVATLLVQILDTAAGTTANKHYIRKNGTRLSNSVVGSPYSCVTSSTGVNIGSIYAGHTAVGSIAELAAFDRPLTSSEISSIESELGAKYGITIAP